MFNIDFKSSRPIYEQIINDIKENILKGILIPGDKLPSIRELSALITTNPNTVSRAYTELERQKVIETMKGKGTYVSTDYIPKMDGDIMNKLKEELKKIIVETHYMGISKEEFLVIIQNVYEEIRS